MPDTAANLTAALSIPVLVIGVDDRIVASNPAADGLIGVAAMGLSYVTVLRQPALLDAIEASLEDAAARDSRFFGQIAKRETSWDVTIRPTRIDAANVVVLCFTDTTASRDAEQMRRDFVTNVSHELRTPLTALMGFIETLNTAAKNDPAAQERFLGIMHTEAERMARLVDDLLSLSRVEEDQRVRPTERVNLWDMAVAGKTSLAALAAQHGSNVSIEGDKSGLVLGDPDQLRRLVINLIENALKYGQEGAPVVVDVARIPHDAVLLGPVVRIAVTDQGAGIAGFHIARLTERFFRVDSHRSREVGGTGLGLAIVKHIVDRHRGRLKITSKIGAGSTFSVLLPTDP